MHYTNEIWFERRKAQCLTKRNKFEEAITIYQKLIPKKSDWFILKELCECYFKVGEYGKALNYARNAAKAYGPINFKVEPVSYTHLDVYKRQTEYFVVDIDHIEEKELSINDLKTKFTQDKRVVLCFVSPGQDGLKLIFRLKERCYDAGIYSIFYKLFLSKFGAEYNIQQVIDTRTSDVARACFVSMDANAYYNPEAEPVDLNQYLNTECLLYTSRCV